MASPRLFRPLTLPTPDGSGLVVGNRAWIAPMCQYAVDRRDGVPTDWHVQHLGSFAAGGFGLVVAEATAVEARGRISPQDLGLWDDDQVAGHARVVDVIHSQGRAAGVQLGHAGMKASTYPMLPGVDEGRVPAAEGGWPVLTAEEALADRDVVVQAFVDATRRAEEAGYDVVQVHAAHGYLLHQALSPLVGGTSDATLLRDVVTAVREAWPASRPLGVRVSATDWVDGGVTVADTVAALEGLDVSWVDVSSGGLTDGSEISVGPAYQTPLAAELARGVDDGVVVSAVGLITEPAQAETILVTGLADAVSLGREALRDPHWAMRAARALRVPEDEVPRAPQFWRA